MLAEGTPRTVLIVSFFVAIAATVAVAAGGYFVRSIWLLIVGAIIWIGSFFAFTTAAFVASRRARVSTLRVMANGVKAAVWFAFHTLP